MEENNSYLFNGSSATCFLLLENKDIMVVKELKIVIPRGANGAIGGIRTQMAAVTFNPPVMWKIFIIKS